VGQRRVGRGMGSSGMGSVDSAGYRVQHDTDAFVDEPIVSPLTYCTRRHILAIYDAAHCLFLVLIVIEHPISRRVFQPHSFGSAPRSLFHQIRIHRRVRHADVLPSQVLSHAQEHLPPNAGHAVVDVPKGEDGDHGVGGPTVSVSARHPGEVDVTYTRSDTRCEFPLG
jgi:hypothetical protein